MRNPDLRAGHHEARVLRATLSLWCLHQLSEPLGIFSLEKKNGAHVSHTAVARMNEAFHESAIPGSFVLSLSPPSSSHAVILAWPFSPLVHLPHPSHISSRSGVVSTGVFVAFRWVLWIQRMNLELQIMASCWKHRLAGLDVQLSASRFNSQHHT